MKNWYNTKLVDATLENYVAAHMLTQGWGRQRVFIKDFFAGQAHISIDMTVGTYLHNLAQHVLEDYMVSRGLKRTYSGHPGELNSDSAPVHEEIQTDLNKSFRGYRDAALGYESKEGKKLVLVVERRDAQCVQYSLYVPEELGDLLSGLFAEAKKKNFYKNKKVTAGCEFLDLADKTWDDVILAPEVKTLLRQIVFRSRELEPIYKKNGLSIKRGVMMSGGPGNGKTSSIKVIAKEATDISVVYAQPSHLIHAKDVREVCQMAKDLAPSIFIIEDIDWIAEDRDTGDAGRVIELMNQLDGLEGFDNVITIATTNDVGKIENAIKNRPGRFDRIITINNPGSDERRQMLALFTKLWVLKDVDVEQVVKFTDGLSGAHMADLCNTAATKAIEDGSLTAEEIAIVTDEHFAAAISEVRDKDFTTYMQQKATKRGKSMGFNQYDEDDDDDY